MSGLLGRRWAAVAAWNASAQEARPGEVWTVRYRTRRAVDGGRFESWTTGVVVKQTPEEGGRLLLGEYELCPGRPGWFDYRHVLALRHSPSNYALLRGDALPRPTAGTGDDLAGAAAGSLVQVEHAWEYVDSPGVLNVDIGYVGDVEDFHDGQGPGRYIGDSVGAPVRGHRVRPAEAATTRDPPPGIGQQVGWWWAVNATRTASLVAGTGGPVGVTVDGRSAALTSITGPDSAGEWLTFRWGFAPSGLATRRQLAACGLRPGGVQPVACLSWRRGRRLAYLYPVERAVPKRAMTPAKTAVLAAAMRARRTCPTCRREADYCIPTSLGCCLDCHDTPTRTRTSTRDAA